VIALYAAKHYEPEFGPPSREETLRHVDGVELLEEPTEAFWGGGSS
jgi:hypothetical protein